MIDLDRSDLHQIVEETFGILIPGDEASEPRQSGTSHQLVLSKIQPGSDRRCLSAIAFHRFRRALMGRRHPRAKVRPEARLVDLLPRFHRRTVWAATSSAAQLALPDLRRPRWLWVSLTYTVLGLSLSSRTRSASLAPATSPFCSHCQVPRSSRPSREPPFAALCGCATRGDRPSVGRRAHSPKPPACPSRRLSASCKCVAAACTNLRTTFSVRSNTIAPETRLRHDLGIL